MSNHIWILQRNETNTTNQLSIAETKNIAGICIIKFIKFHIVITHNIPS